MSDRPRIVSHLQAVSAFGTSFWFRGDSAADYVLHPVFLRFAILCVGIYVLLDDSDLTDGLVGWQLPMLWLAMTFVAITGYVVIGTWILYLYRRGFIRRLYTPFLLLPIVVIVELTRQAVVVVLQAGDWLPLPIMLLSVTRDFLVIILMDVMHVQFVAPLHPLVRIDAPDDARETPAEERVAQFRPQRDGAAGAATPSASRQTLIEIEVAGDATPAVAFARDVPDAAPIGEPDRAVLRIADRVFPIADIQSVRTEDHYLNIVTRTSRSMVRAKLSDLAALHDGRHGVQINRSQWVAFAAIDSVRDEENGQVTLHLVNGDSATVSRTRRLMFMQLFNSQRTRTI
jgi:hypothetical protein